MDVNGHRFWSFADAGAFDLSQGECVWRENCLQLAGRVEDSQVEGNRAEAIAASNLPSVTVGRFRDYAWIDPTLEFQGQVGALVASSNKEAAVPVMALPEGAEIGDLSIDDEGVLRLVGKLSDDVQGLFLTDMRGRWSQPVAVEMDASPDRVTKSWVLHRITGRLWKQAGNVLPELALREFVDHIFRPDPEYTDHVRLKEFPLIDLQPNELILDCAERRDGSIAVLIVSSAQRRQTRLLFITSKNDRISVDLSFKGFASSIGWLSEDRILLTFPRSNKGIAFDVMASHLGLISLLPDHYPLKGLGPQRICRGETTPCWYSGSNGAQPLHPCPAHALSLQTHRAEGVAFGADIIDSQKHTTLWHRLVVEGDFPVGTRGEIAIRVFDDLAAIEDAEFHIHQLGEVNAETNVPRLGWLSEPSELPNHAGLVGKPIKLNETGCFSGLVQASDRKSRELVGRYAQIKVKLFGAGHLNPAIAAIRLYGDRFSLVKNYLPNALKPSLDPKFRSEISDADPLDFFDRFTANFEQILTRLEDKVVAAPSLTNPLSAKSEALEWLSGWIGMTLRSGLSEDQKRMMLANGMRINRRRGTLGGLRLALDIVSNGQIGSGGIVVLEDYRLRRVFSTILGEELGTAFDPILAGPVEGGNSKVGRTLFLGDADQLVGGRPNFSSEQIAELLALYRAPTDQDDFDDVREFFERLAWQVTVIVHHDVGQKGFELIRDTTRRLTPAHVKLRVERASHPLIVGLYSLAGVDTYLKPRPDAMPVVTGRSLLGVQDHVLQLPTLDPRFNQGDHYER